MRDALQNSPRTMPSNRKRPDLRARAVELSKLGWGIKRIAREIGCSTTLVAKARREAGMPTWIGPRGGWQPEERAIAAIRDALADEAKIIADSETQWLEHPECAAWKRTPYYWRDIANNRRKASESAKRQYHARKHDGAFRARLSARTRIWKVCKERGSYKTAGTEALLGCTVEQFREHIASQFKRGMTWANYGRWEVDHIIPCASFDLSKPDQQRQCFHFTNLQPLWQSENRRKSDNVPANHQPCLTL